MWCMWILFVISSCMIYAFPEKRIIIKNNLFSGGRKINKGIVEGDIILRKLRTAIRGRYYRWPNGTVPYVISNNFSNTESKTFRTSMTEIEINTRNNVSNCITFVERTTEADYIDFQLSSGCTSYIGRVGGAQQLYVGRHCLMKGGIIHELIHALGFFHEHNRYDRHRYIYLHTKNIAVGDRPLYYKETNRTMDLLGTPYDFSSLMHYGAYDGSMDKSQPFISPKDDKKYAGVVMGHHYTMSQLDVKRIQKLYKCKIDTSHIIKFDTVFRCSFDNGMCNLQQDTQDDFDWKRQVSFKIKDESRPFADFTNGIGKLMASSPLKPKILRAADEATPPFTRENGGGDSTHKERYYIYAEVKAHRGKKARLLTQKFDRGQYCIHFGIYFQNPQNGAFKILSRGPNITEHTVITILSIYEGKWQEYMIDLLAPSSFRLILQAEIGDGQKSDIAIDDFAIYRSTCSDILY